MILFEEKIFPGRTLVSVPVLRESRSRSSGQRTLLTHAKFACRHWDVLCLCVCPDRKSGLRRAEQSEAVNEITQLDKRTLMRISSLPLILNGVPCLCGWRWWSESVVV